MKINRSDPYPMWLYIELLFVVMFLIITVLLLINELFTFDKSLAENNIQIINQFFVIIFIDGVVMYTIAFIFGFILSLFYYRHFKYLFTLRLRITGICIMAFFTTWFFFFSHQTLIRDNTGIVILAYRILFTMGLGYYMYSLRKEYVFFGEYKKEQNDMLDHILDK